MILNNCKNINKKNKKGFTLMEVVIILFISTIGVAASLSLALKSAYFQSVQKDLLGVVFLANEGLELMTNFRDTNMIIGNDYDNFDGFGSAGIGENFYKVDYYTLLATSTENIDETILQQDEVGFYVYNTSTDSIFKRMITTRAETSASTTVESWIKWSRRGEDYNYKLETVLYDLSF
ncbi:MAG TPA: prepilin-type N-terminal cleavage/methylation domain-containing protein [bacterium]|nr:prepilin-type N-terminal cleavage/methylation domain-containing protein [bacterium]